MNHLLTIYTPTYNRANLLPRVYKSLCAQTCKDFLWMIIDDGSTDDTKHIVREWIDENIIDIEYHYKENGGVHTARDMAYHLCSSELIASCDSDDMITENAVELWLYTWKRHGGRNFSGIFSVAVDENGKRVTDTFPNEKALSYQDFTYKYHCRKEKDSVMNMSVVSTLEDYPVFNGEKLVGEGFKWIQFPQDKPFILLDKVTRIYEQQPDGYMRNVVQSRFANPNGFRESYKQTIIKSIYIKPKIRGYLGYIAFSLILRDKNYIKKSPNPFITMLLTPLGAGVYLKYCKQKRSLTKEK